VTTRRSARTLVQRAASLSSRQAAGAGGGAVAGEPGFLGGEAGDRREPGGQAIEQRVEHGAAGAPAQAVGPVAVERILADVEVEGREVDGAEIVQRRPDRRKREIVDRAPDLPVEFDEAVQYPPLQFGHLGGVHALGGRESVERAQEVAKRVADAAVKVGLMLQDFRSDAQILGIVGADHPDS